MRVIAAGMKQRLFVKLFTPIIPVVLLLAFGNGCTKIKGCTDPAALNYVSAAQVSDSSCQYYGTVTFYFAAPGPQAIVVVNASPAQTGTVSTPITGTVACGDSGCATFTLSPGSYTDSVSSSLFTWKDTFTVTSKGCTTILLPQSTGYLSFWCSNISYGSITVTVDNRVSTITNFPSTAPVCR